MEWLRKKCCPPEDKSMEELIKLKEITEAVIDAYNKDITLLSLNLNCSLLIPSRENTLKKLICDTKKNLDKRTEELNRIQNDIHALQAKNKAKETTGNGGAEERGPNASTRAVAEETLPFVPMDFDDKTLAPSSTSGDEDQQSPEDVNSLEANFGSEADYLDENYDLRYGNSTFFGYDLTKSAYKTPNDKSRHHKDIFGGHIYTESELIKSQERKLAQDICYMDMILDDLLLEGLFTNVQEYDEAVTSYDSCTEEEYFSAQED